MKWRDETLGRSFSRAPLTKRAIMIERGRDNRAQRGKQASAQPSTYGWPPRLTYMSSSASLQATMWLQSISWIALNDLPLHWSIVFSALAHWKSVFDSLSLSLQNKTCFTNIVKIGLFSSNLWYKNGNLKCLRGWMCIWINSFQCSELLYTEGGSE